MLALKNLKLLKNNAKNLKAFCKSYFKTQCNV